MRRKRYFSRTVCFLLCALFAVLFLMPTVLTITNAFMTQSEITANYGQVFQNANDGKSYISKRINLKFIPDKVSFTQFFTVLLKSPDYLLKFWNSVILTVPITLFQLMLAVVTSYGFARYPGKIKSIIFFAYIILMLMPYQVTLVPNYLVADHFGMLETSEKLVFKGAAAPLNVFCMMWSRRAVLLPSIFSPFSIFLPTKVMRRIPISYVEAAKLDGAGEFQIMTKIYLPLCKSSLVSIGMLVFIDYWNMVEQPLVLLTDAAKQPLSVFLSQINEPELGIAFAASSVYMIPPLLIFFWGEDYLVEGISRSGIK
jgi:multiple sugar transport system permease protein